MRAPSRGSRPPGSPRAGVRTREGRGGAAGTPKPAPPTPGPGGRGAGRADAQPRGRSRTLAPGLGAREGRAGAARWGGGRASRARPRGRRPGAGREAPGAPLAAPLGAGAGAGGSAPPQAGPRRLPGPAGGRARELGLRAAGGHCGRRRPGAPRSLREVRRRGPAGGAKLGVPAGARPGPACGGRKSRPRAPAHMDFLRPRPAPAAPRRAGRGEAPRAV